MYLQLTGKLLIVVGFVVPFAAELVIRHFEGMVPQVPPNQGQMLISLVSRLAVILFGALIAFTGCCALSLASYLAKTAAVKAPAAR